MNTFFRISVLICALPTLANAAPDSKYVSDKINSSAADEFSVSAAQAETAAKKVFCGIQGKGCEADSLTSACAAVENKKKQLGGFKCNVYLTQPSPDLAFDAMNVNLAGNLAYHSSAKTERPASIDLSKQSKTPVKPKGISR